MKGDLKLDTPSIPSVGDASVPSGSSSGSKKHYHVGTLSYTARGLMFLFAWMLWGDFCFTLMETVINILPLKLRDLGASNTTMALIMTTLPGILNSTICPWVSFWSDRYRSNWGRRIPFIIWTAPFLSLFLILLGYSEPIGQWVHQTFFSQGGAISAAQVAIFLMGVFMIGFQFFNMFVGSVYWYLFNDVVPEAFLGRFLGLFRMVGSFAGALYGWYIVPHAGTHMKEIFLGAALLYLFGFGLMCLRVKEGTYPPPPENIGGKKGLFSGVKTFMVECYSLKYYWFFFLTNTFMAMAGACVSAFGYLLSMNLGLDLKQIGQVGAYTSIVAMFLQYPSGILSDRYHPIRVMICALIGIVATPIGIIYLFYDFTPQTVYYISVVSSIVSLPIGLMYGAASLPIVHADLAQGTLRPILLRRCPGSIGGSDRRGALGGRTGRSSKMGLQRQRFLLSLHFGLVLGLPRSPLSFAC